MLSSINITIYKKIANFELKGGCIIYKKYSSLVFHSINAVKICYSLANYLAAFFQQTYMKNYQELTIDKKFS